MLRGAKRNLDSALRRSFRDKKELRARARLLDLFSRPNSSFGGKQPSFRTGAKVEAAIRRSKQEAVQRLPERVRERLQELEVLEGPGPLGLEEVEEPGPPLHGRRRNWPCERAERGLHGAASALDDDKAVRIQALYNFPSSETLPGPLQRAHHRPHQRLLPGGVTGPGTLGETPAPGTPRRLPRQVLLKEP